MSENYRRLLYTVTALVFSVVSLSVWLHESDASPEPRASREAAVIPTVYHRTVKIDGLDVFYREAGPKGAPVVLLLHGFPTSSHMFRDLIPALSDRYHVVAPDYPGYGNSSMPKVDEFNYTFDRLADVVEKFTEKLELDRYSLYVMDYGAPVGFRLATKHPERVESLIVQNGNAYVEGIDNHFWAPIKEYWNDRDVVGKGFDNPFWKAFTGGADPTKLVNREVFRSLVSLDATKWQYLNGARNPETISPDNWHVTQRLLDRPGNAEIQLQLFYDYGSNPPLYPAWQKYFRTHQPPTLIVWGDKDEIFPAAGAHPYQRDLKDVELHLFDTGHFALEEDGDAIAKKIRNFLARKVSASTTP
ncbi:MAG: alpha/beta hydrolase [Planctomycetota bacterium]